MGASSLEEMMETAGVLGLSQRYILEWHVLDNHYPQPPYSVVDIAEKAIELAIDEDYDAIIQFSDFDEKFGNKSMRVGDIMEKLHLWKFIEAGEEE